MNPKNQVSGISIVVFVVSVVLVAAGAASLHNILHHIGAWQAAAYAIVTGVFIALIGVILTSILTFFLDD